MQLKYHDTGREKECLPQVGQWNMMNKVSCLGDVEHLIWKFVVSLGSNFQSVTNIAVLPAIIARFFMLCHQPACH